MMRSYFVLSLQLNISRMKRLRCPVFLPHSLIDFVVQVFFLDNSIKSGKTHGSGQTAKSTRFKGKNEKNQNSSEKLGELPFKEFLVSEK